MNGTRRRIGIVDIGSNSIRLVVYDGVTRAPSPVFNEKVLCGLGRDIDRTGRLSEEGVAAALPNLARFARLSEVMAVERLDLLATAAVRDAENGADFVAEVEKMTGHRVRTLSGTEEAHLSALGVLSAIPDADGVMGDMGGGSLELVEMSGGEPGRSVTLSLGPLRLLARFGTDRAAARKEIDAQLAGVSWLPEVVGKTFFPVGGTWRNLAKLGIDQEHHPLHVVHGYSLTRPYAQDLARLVSRLGSNSLAGIRSVPRRRLDTLPIGALVLHRLIKKLACDKVTFSAYGLREGFLFDQLDEETRKVDPLIAMASEWAGRDPRFEDPGPFFNRWMEPLFAGDGHEGRRLRLAACHISDLAWREHPDYRAVQAFWQILRHPLVGVDHGERMFLAYAIAVRYGATDQGKIAEEATKLLDPATAARARLIGLALRLGYRLAGATPRLLDRSSLVLSNGTVEVGFPEDGSILPGEAVSKRLQSLKSAYGAVRGRTG